MFGSGLWSSAISGDLKGNVGAILGCHVRIVRAVFIGWNKRILVALEAMKKRVGKNAWK